MIAPQLALRAHLSVIELSRRYLARTKSPRAGGHLISRRGSGSRSGNSSIANVTGNPNLTLKTLRELTARIYAAISLEQVGKVEARRRIRF